MEQMQNTATIRLFGWCELDGDLIHIPDVARQREIDAEGSWHYQELLPNGVVVLATDRHIALECWAIDEAEARAKFSALALFRQQTA